MSTGMLPPALAGFIANLPPLTDPSPKIDIDIDSLLSHLLRIDLPQPFIAPIAPPRSFFPRPPAPLMQSHLPPPHTNNSFVPPVQAAVESKPEQRLAGKRKIDDSEVKRQDPPIDIFKLRQMKKMRR